MTEHQHQASPAAGGEGASQLKRGLSARHIQMIALGGAIGTGLFMGAGAQHRRRRHLDPGYLCAGRVLYLYGDAGDGRAAAHPP